MSFRVIIPHPECLRRISSGFGWVDHRLVRQGFTSRLSLEAQTLYLFLVTVANESGLSWYSDEKLCQQSNLSARLLDSARKELLSCSLLAYSPPVYQLLEIPGISRLSKLSVNTQEPDKKLIPEVRHKRFEESLSIDEILRQIIAED